MYTNYISCNTCSGGVSQVNEEKLVTLDTGSLDFTALRQAAFDKHLKARLASAARAHAELEAQKESEQVFPCQHCDENADYWCKDCGCYICDDCRDADPPKPGHVEETHDVIDVEDQYVPSPHPYLRATRVIRVIVEPAKP